MKVGSLKSLFAELAQFLHNRGAGKQAAMVRELAGLFDGYESKNVGDFAKKLRQWKGKLRTSETSSCLRTIQSVLQEFQALLRLSTALKTASDIGRIVMLLEGCGHETIAAFVADARADVQQQAMRARKTPTPQLRIDVVQAYADELTAHSQDYDAFNLVVARLKEDKKKVRAVEMKAIADRYSGYDTRRKKRGEALKAIQERQRLDARHAAKGRSHRAVVW
ncbi:MAG: hypothetical protein ACREC6_05235 [Hyphomicrobiaceae bacterium]